MLIDEENHLKILHIFMFKNPIIFKNRIEWSFFNQKKNVYLCKSYNPTPS